MSKFRMRTPPKGPLKERVVPKNKDRCVKMPLQRMGCGGFSLNKKYNLNIKSYEGSSYYGFYKRLGRDVCSV